MTADDNKDPVVPWLTRGMMALATVALELAVVEPGRSMLLSVVATLGMLVAPALVVAWALDRAARFRSEPGAAARERSRGHRGAPSPLSVVALLALFVAPLAAYVARRAWWGHGSMLEVALLSSLRNLGIGLAVLAQRQVCAKLGALVSLFLMLIAVSLGEGRLIFVWVGAYAVAGTSWLMLASWKAVFRETEGVAAQRLPWSAAAWVLGIVVALIPAAVFVPGGAAMVLAGLVPTSGGTDGNDPEARGGVNDGDNEVSASKAPQSVGFTQSELYLDSDRPSLYDTFNDMYGEPLKPKKIERMIAMSPGNIREQKERPTENLRAGREFSLVRRKPEPSSRRPGDRQADALLYVKGATPLHLRLTAYDRFDGRTWREEPIYDFDCPLEPIGEGPWLRLARPTQPIYNGKVSHQIKVGTLDSSSLPVPAHLTRFRVGSVGRPDFFGWAQDGVVRMVGRTVPAGTVIETEARIVDPRLVAAAGWVSWKYASSSRVDPRKGQPVDPAVVALARDWVEGIPAGWRQVEAVVAALRKGYAVDRTATAPSDGSDLVAHFLLRSRRGPDYQFATAAAVLLRSLDYTTRLVSGFYVDPNRLDPRTRHTPVHRQDVHVWAEVLLPSGIWVAVEPTPGYELMVPAPSLSERAAMALTAIARAIVKYRVALGISLVVLAAALRFRRNLLDGLATLAWRISAGGAWRYYVLGTLTLVDRRSRWAGRPRPPGLTPARWYGPIAGAVAAGHLGDLDRLVRLANLILYAPEGARQAPPWTEHDIRSTCRRVVRDWTLGRLRASARTPMQREREVTL